MAAPSRRRSGRRRRLRRARHRPPELLTRRLTVPRPADLPLLAQATLPLARLRAELHRAAPELPPPAAGHPPLPAAPPRAGALWAHAEITREERTTRYQVERAFRLGHRANWRVARPPAAPRHRRGGPPARIAGACRRRLRPRPRRGRGARRGQPPHVKRYLRSPDEREAIEVVAIDPYDAYPRRSRPHYRERGSAAIPSTCCAAPTPHSTQSGAGAGAEARPLCLAQAITSASTPGCLASQASRQVRISSWPSRSLGGSGTSACTVSPLVSMLMQP